MSEINHSIELNKLKELKPNFLKSLAQNRNEQTPTKKYQLRLQKQYAKDPSSLTKEQIKLIDEKPAKPRNHFHLNSVEILDPKLAEYLIDCNFNEISLEKLKSVSPRIMEQLAKFNGQKLILGIHTLDLPTAKALSKYQGKELELPHLKPVSPEVQKILDDLKTRGMSIKP